MSATPSPPFFISTRGFTRVFNGQPLLESSPLANIVQDGEPIYDKSNLWGKDPSLRKEVYVDSFNAGESSPYFSRLMLGGVCHNCYSRDVVIGSINWICGRFDNSTGFTRSLIEMIDEEIFGPTRRRGIWEILIISEKHPGQVPSSSLFSNFSDSTREFEIDAIRIQRHRDSFSDRLLTRRGVSYARCGISGLYDPTNSNSDIIENLLKHR
jgi:hypothetical protein